MAEAVTLAHFARPVALSAALTGHNVDVHLATHPRYLGLVKAPRSFTHHLLGSVSTQRFKDALAKGAPLYDKATLGNYVEEDLALLREVRPDVVVGDFRLSLAVSAVVAEIPYVSLINAYWSPYARVRYVVPDLPVTRILGPNMGQRLFDLIRPLAFAQHAAPLNAVRRRYGLSSLGGDLRTTYSWADHVLYPDLPQAMVMNPLPPNHRFLGPILWSPDIELPGWWRAIPDDRPAIYVSLGSSGRDEDLPTVIKALGTLSATLLVSTAGQATLSGMPHNVLSAAYLPGEAATKRADLVICNGGSQTVYQALAAGVPVLGLPSNMDQHLSMQAVERLNAGLSLRSDRTTSAMLAAAARTLLDHRSPYRQGAADAANLFAAYDGTKRFEAFIGELVHL